MSVPGRFRASKRALALLAAVAGLSAPAAAQDQQAAPPAWRVECSGDGKTLDCRAVQQLIAENKQLVLSLAARMGADKVPTLGMQLPLGINLAEPVQLKVDAKPEEKFSVQTCTASGCLLNVPLKDPLLASMRTGTTLKVTVFDQNKRPIAIDVPLLGFGLAYDKATK
ncbi:invasion associated locus B family protein [Reyranella massiliensis]|uniref:invasion associated locus B family protein n=1 Tax=Reyranella massiliensis TaxID=445220 RepID=UPI000303F0C3|nr:invasion associated locus B family protein [Reyranella massiliensis]